jgi:hypothetical protein
MVEAPRWYYRPQVQGQISEIVQAFVRTATHTVDLIEAGLWI